MNARPFQRNNGGGYNNNGNREYYDSRRGGVPPDSYTCNRCHEKGHYIKDCPTNNDPEYEPARNQGIPKSQLFASATATSEEFQKTMNKTMKSLVKNIQLYALDDITSLTFNPNHAKPMSSMISNEMGEEEQINIGRYPPSLLCKHCKNLL